MLTRLVTVTAGAAVLLGLAGAAPVAQAAAMLASVPLVSPPTRSVALSGSGFLPSETVTIAFDGMTVATTSTDADGALVGVDVAVPASALPGRHAVSAVGSGGDQASFTLLVRTDWNMYGFTPGGGRFNQYENVLNATNVPSLAVLWSAALAAPVNAAVAVATNTVYAATTNGIAAFNATTGAPRWSATVLNNGGVVQSASAVANGIVFAGFADGIRAYSAQTGMQLWFMPTNSGITSPVTANGAVYVTDSQALYALDQQTGAPLWTFAASSSFSSPASRVAATNGIVYLASDQVHALDAATGAVLWSTKSLVVNYTGPIAALNGRVVVNQAITGIAVFDAQTGAQLFVADPNPLVPLLGAAAADGRIYAASNRASLYAFSITTGRQFWFKSIPHEDIPLSTPAIANKVVYATLGNAFLAYDAKSGPRQILDVGVGGGNLSDPVVANGIVYLGSTDGHVYALSVNGKRPAEATLSPDFETER